MTHRRIGPVQVRWAIAIAAACAVVALTLVAQRTTRPLRETLGFGPDQGERLRCEPEPGMLAVYRLQLHTEMKLNASALLTDAPTQKAGQLLPTDAGFSARLRFRAVEPRKGGMFVALALDEIEANAGTLDLPADVRRELTTPFYGVLAPECRFVELAFGRTVSDDVVNRIQGVVQSLSLAIDPDPRKRVWASREHDAVGQYAARYKRPDLTASQIVKVRQNYLRTHPTIGFSTKESLLVRVVDSRAPVTLDDDHGWLSQFESREHLQILRTSGSMVADLKSTLRLERTDEDAESIALARTDADLRWRKPSDPPLFVLPRKPDPPLAMKTMPLEVALAEYTSIMRSGADGVVAKGADYLALYLRARPAMAFELIRMLQRQAIPADLESTIYLGLELAGTPEAHDALIEGLSDDHVSRNRSRAAAALPDISEPSIKTLQALTETARNAESESPDDTRLVRNSATFAIGTLEQRTRTSDPALAQQALATLRGTLSTASGDQQQVAALAAIGNSGNPALLTDVMPLLKANERLVRAHAVQAMGHMEPAANQDIFKGLIAREPDAQIRGTIAVTYADQAKRANQTPPLPVVDGAIAQLAQEPDPRVRGLLIELIGPACAGHPGALQALAQQFRRETDPILLRLIGKWVPGNQLGP